MNKFKEMNRDLFVNCSSLRMGFFWCFKILVMMNLEIGLGFLFFLEKGFRVLRKWNIFCFFLIVVRMVFYWRWVILV